MIIPKWANQKIVKDRDTREEIIKYEPDEKSWKDNAKDICDTLHLKVWGLFYSYKDFNGNYKLINKDVETLTEMLQREYEERQDGNSLWNYIVWKHISRNIKPFIPEMQVNYKYISFKNKSIDMEESIKNKELVIVDKVDTQDEILFELKDDVKSGEETFNKIIETYTYGMDENKSQKFVERLLTISAYILSPINNMNRLPIFKSKPGTGKSVWLNILQEIFGSGISQSYDPLMDDDFAETGIYGKRFVYNDDLQKGKWPRQAIIQSLISGSSVAIRMSGGKNVQWIKPNAKFLFLTNYDIEADPSAGIWDRIDVLEFGEPVRGTSREDLTIKDKSLNKDVIEYIINKIVFIGLDNVIKGKYQRNIEYVKNTKNKTNIYKEFKKDLFNKSETIKNKWEEGFYIIKPIELYNLWKQWMKVNGNEGMISKINKSTFIENFDSIISEEARSKPRNIPGVEKTIAVYNLSLDSDWKEENE